MRHSPRSLEGGGDRSDGALPGATPPGVRGPQDHSAIPPIRLGDLTPSADAAVLLAGLVLRVPDGSKDPLLLGDCAIWPRPNRPEVAREHARTVIGMAGRSHGPRGLLPSRVPEVRATTPSKESISEASRTGPAPRERFSTTCRRACDREGASGSARTGSRGWRRTWGF